MKIHTLEVVTDVGRRFVKRAGLIDVEPTGDMPPYFRSLTETLWGRLREESGHRKIHTIEVVTDVGRRVVKLSAPLDVDVEPAGDMPPQFRSLTEVLWGLLREVAAQSPSPTEPKAEA